MRFTLTLVLVLTFCVAISQPAVDGFSKGKGNLDIVLSYTYEDFSNYFAAPGDERSFSRTSHATTLFLASGLTNWLDVQINLPYISNDQESDFQDFNIYLKGKLIDSEMYNGRLSIFAAAGFANPMSEYDTESAYAIGQQATSLDGRLVLQFFHQSGFFAMLQSGYTYRTNIDFEEQTPSSVPIAVKVGLAKEKYYLELWYDYQNAEDGKNYPERPFYAFGVSYSKLGFSYYRPFSKVVGASAGAYKVLSGQNVGESLGLSAAIIFKLNYLKKE